MAVNEGTNMYSAPELKSGVKSNPSNDIYGIEVFLSFCVEDQKFLTGSKESLSLKNLAKKWQE